MGDHINLGLVVDPSEDAIHCASQLVIGSGQNQVVMGHHARGYVVLKK